jgi:hypothetical protein
MATYSSGTVYTAESTLPNGTIISVNFVVELTRTPTNPLNPNGTNSFGIAVRGVTGFSDCPEVTDVTKAAFAAKIAMAIQNEADSYLNQTQAGSPERFTAEQQKFYYGGMQAEFDASRAADAAKQQCMMSENNGEDLNTKQFAVETRPDGTVKATVFDVVNSASDHSTYITSPGGELQLVHSTFTGVDNAAKNVDYDPTHTQPYQTQTTTIDALNRTDKVDTLYDDNHRVVTDYDEKAASTVAYVQTTYDAQARTDLVTTVNDNGSSATTDFDQANGAAWRSITNNYGTTGQLTTQTGIYDSNASWLNYYDNAARLDVTYAYDTTAHLSSVTDYDQAGSAAWASIVSSYNTAGQLTSQVGVNDNSSNWVSYFDSAEILAAGRSARACPNGARIP